MKRMHVIRMIVLLAFGLWLGSAAFAQEASDVKPPEAANVIPNTELVKLASIVQIPRGTSRSDAIKLFMEKAPEAIEMGRALEEKYPKAENLHEVQGFMLQMASTLAEQTKDKTWWKTTDAIADRMLKNDPEPDVKAFAVSFQTRRMIEEQDLEGEDLLKAIREYVAKFDGTEAAPQAHIRGIMMAAEHKQREVMDALADELQKNYLTSPGVAAFLKRQLGREISFVGKPFEATLTRLDGTKLNLPDDLKGKVVVIDFWATWCGPCIASLDHMRSFYADYKDKGVEIVGISLDQPKKLDHLKSFVEKENLNWIQSYSGEFWNDPTASKYGIAGIPSVWVLDKQGRIYSEDARGREGEVVDEILAGKTASEKLQAAAK